MISHPRPPRVETHGRRLTKIAYSVFKRLTRLSKQVRTSKKKLKADTKCKKSNKLSLQLLEKYLGCVNSFASVSGVDSGK